MKENGMLLIVWFVFGLFGCTGSIAAVADKHPKAVLFIASYHPGFPTFFDEVEGLKSVLQSPTVRLDIEFMDAKRFDARQLDQIFLSNLSRKLVDLPPYDLIIAGDDAATHFAVQHQKDLFHDRPVVFFGVNNVAYGKSFDQNPNVTGVIEKPAFMETAKLIRRLYGANAPFFVITDASPTAQVDMMRFRQEMQEAGIDNYRVLSLAQLTFAEMLGEVKKLRPPASILLVSPYRDVEGEIQDFSQTLADIHSNAQVPIFNLWQPGMGQGVLGGKLSSLRLQAVTAGRMAQQILNGTNPGAIPVVQDLPAAYVFDYREMQRFGLRPRDLPAGSRLINAPDPLYERYRNYIIVSAMLLMMLAVIIAGLLLRMRARRRFEQEILRVNEELESKVERRTRSLEQARQEAESLLRLQNTILDNSLVSIVLIRRGKVEWINAYAETMFGYNSPDVIGNISDFIYQHREDFIQVGREAPPMLRRGETYQAECAFRRKDGSALWGIISARALNPDDLGEGVLLIIVDITARKRAEERLKVLNARLETLATTDHLTGISNRRQMAQVIDKEINRTSRYANPLSVILLDIDHFKQLNDRHGHLLGDEVLKGVAGLLRQTCRQADTVARWGGEEFLVLCPSTPLAEAEKLAELLRQRLLECNFGLPEPVTASFGVAQYQADLSLDALLADADAALYRAKESRNCVKTHPLTS